RISQRGCPTGVCEHRDARWCILCFRRRTEMKRMVRGICAYGAAIVLVAVAGWGTAAAQSDTAFGLGALNNGSFDNNNSAFGFETLFSDSSGYDNSAFGANSMFANSTGYDNTAAGVSALQNNTSGYRNTAVGFQALLRNTTGFYNAAAGAKA